MCSLRNLIISSCIGFGLVACASPSPEQQRQVDEAACQNYGFAQGTPDFAACLQREQHARQYGGHDGYGGYGSSVGVGVGGGSYGGGGFGGVGIGFGF
jgi:uncharacterized membrane protein YgcG